jgi:hypothetical protein
MDNNPNANFHIQSIKKDGFGKQYKQDFSNFVYKVKKAVYKIALVVLLLNMLIAYSQGGNLLFALLHPSFMNAAKEIPSESIDSVTEYMLSFKREIKQEIEKKQKDFFKEPAPIKEEKSSNPVSVVPSAKAAEVTVAKSSDKIAGLTTVTAYSPSVDETDATPCVAEPSNLNICNIMTKRTNGMRICASNDYPIGQVLKIEPNFAGGKCVVLDRMRDHGKVDVFFMTKAEAKKFGNQPLKVAPVEKISLDKVNDLFGIKTK